MNERIRKLAKKAGATINEGFDGNKDFVYGITMSPEECEKFAELIVRECILTIQKGISLDGNTTEKFLRTMKHLKDIKEHFGVEE